MTVPKLIRHFEALGRAPIDIADIVKQFRNAMPDEVIRITGVDLPAEILRGAHYRYRHKPNEASAVNEREVVQLIYSKQQPLCWQRLVVCKELIHLYDDSGIETDQPTEVVDLIQHLSGAKPKAIKSGGLQWFFDELAQYQAMAMLFPFSAREEIIAAGKSEKRDEIAAKMQLPHKAVDFVLSDQWKTLRESILII